MVIIHSIYFNGRCYSRFVDIDLRNMLIDEELIEGKINENTKAIMVVSLLVR